MDFPIVISYYTKNTPYEEEVKNLIASCKKFNLTAEIDPIESFGSWELNCAYKPFFILEKLRKFQKPVFWVDADGVFKRKPEWLGVFDADFAVRYHPEYFDDHPSKVLSGSIFVRPSSGGEKILKLWIEKTQKRLLDPNRGKEFWDQVALRDALFETKATFGHLPISYTKIFDDIDDAMEGGDPVIEHYQASRRFKKIISPMNGYATHLVPTITTAMQSGILWPNSSILELGCGHYSTPILSSIAKLQKRKFQIVSSDPIWASQFKNDADSLELIDWSKYASNGEWGMVLVDHEEFVSDPFPQLFKINESAKIVVFHDANRVDKEQWSLVSMFYKYIYFYDRYIPKTAILSNYVDPSEWFLVHKSI